jgi:hypothetical protein
MNRWGTYTIGTISIMLACMFACKAQEWIPPIIIPQAPVTNQQKSQLEDSLISAYSKAKQAINGNIIPDSVARKTSIKREYKPSDYLLYYVYNYDFYTTFIAQQTINAIDPTSDRSNIYFYYNATFNSRVNVKKIRWNFYLFNEYGKKKYFDSISVKTDDLYYFKNSLNYTFAKDKIAITTMMNVKSQFWKTFDYKEDTSGTWQRYTYASYFSPGYILYSAGMTYNFWESSTIELGLVSGKITKIKNQEIFEERDAEKLYGIEKGQKQKIQYGLNLQVNIVAKKFGKHFIWEHYSQLYIPNEHLGDVSFMTFEMNNAFHFMFMKYMRLSLRTKINYDQNIQERPQIINQFSVGFYLSNILR